MWLSVIRIALVLAIILTIVTQMAHIIQTEKKNTQLEYSVSQLKKSQEDA